MSLINTTKPLQETVLTSQEHNPYQLILQLGEGGSGSVFKAIQKNTGQVVALKLFHTVAEKSDINESEYRKKSCRLMQNFERETTLCARLHHPNIVKLLDRGKTDHGQLFAIFEFVPGETLRDLLIRQGSLSAFETGEFMGQVLDALTCAHANGIAHRDLKPQNIMISKTGTRNHVKILDFGIASLVAEDRCTDFQNCTLVEDAMCSPAYSAPEQLRGEPPTVKMDIYAWGLLVLECLTGKAVVSGTTISELFNRHLSNVEMPIPAALISHPIAELLRRTLRKNPAERIGNATQLYQDFQKINFTNIVANLTENCYSKQKSQAITSEYTQQYIPDRFDLAYEQ
ncbi:protein kinase domain-containing protein [Undibacterium sp. SXout20W]|uniref:protein kinase domain-containing protein n=1 Tax=Undibacterium sp. SXout20W TaxID=3413051 RepID=UPI003BF01772